MTVSPQNFQRKLASTTSTLLVGGTLLALPISARAHGDLEIRIGEASQAIAADTNNAVLYLQRAELHREHLAWPAAAADYDRAERLDPKLTTIDFYRGRMLADAGQLADALKCFNAHLVRNPTDGLGFIERARAKARSGKHDDAVKDFKHGLELMGEPQPEFFLECAQSFLAQGQTNLAVASLDEGIKRLGPVVTLQAFAVDLELADKRFAEAIARLNTIIPNAARKENWYARRGEIQLLAGQSAAARESFEAALRAIEILPARLQLNAPMANLRLQINQRLREMTNTPPANTISGK